MIQLTFHREAVCMGDDVQNGTYHIEMPDDADLGDLMDVILHGGRGNDWPIPFTGAHSYWVIESNIGDLANIWTDGAGYWHTGYIQFNSRTPLKSLGITSTFGRRK